MSTCTCTGGMQSDKPDCLLLRGDALLMLQTAASAAMFVLQIRRRPLGQNGSRLFRKSHGVLQASLRKGYIGSNIPPNGEERQVKSTLNSAGRGRPDAEETRKF